jgi:hypothetical protein
MSPPPTSIDGTDITGATIDGQEVQEITIDGQTVFTSEIQFPDSQNIYARYAADNIVASDGDPISTWTDLSGNNRDLTAGDAPSYNDSWRNGLPALRFRRTQSEFLSVDWTDLPQPLTVFFVFQQVSVDGFDYHFDGFSNDNVALENDGTGRYRFFAGSSADVGSTDTSDHIATCIFDGNVSEFRIDGSQVFSGNVGSNNMDGLTIAMAGNGSKQPADLNVGEVIVYETNQSSQASNIESLLSGKWGISV